MPCHSDYMEQNASEAKAQRAAKLLLWLDHTLDDFGPDCGFLTTRERNKFALQDTYYAQDVGQTQLLCKEVKTLQDAGSMDDILKEYFRDPNARDLANWINEHKEQDRVNAEVEIHRIRQDKIDKITDRIKNLDDKQIDQIDRLVKIFQVKII